MVVGTMDPNDGWSQWAEDPQSGQRYRARYMPDGSLEYQWEGEVVQNDGPRHQPADEVPRGQQANEITEQLANMNLSGGGTENYYPNPNPAYTYGTSGGPGYGTSGYGTPGYGSSGYGASGYGAYGATPAYNSYGVPGYGATVTSAYGTSVATGTGVVTGTYSSTSSTVVAGYYGNSAVPQEDAASAKGKSKGKGKDNKYHRRGGNRRSSGQPAGSSDPDPSIYGPPDPFYNPRPSRPSSVEQPGTTDEPQTNSDGTPQDSSASTPDESHSPPQEAAGEEQTYNEEQSHPAGSWSHQSQELSDEYTAQSNAADSGYELRQSKGKPVWTSEQHETGAASEYEQYDETSPSAYLTGQASSSYDTSSAYASQSYQHPNAEDQDDQDQNDDGQTTPTQHGGHHNVQAYPVQIPPPMDLMALMGGKGKDIVLPPEYVVEPSSRFVPGEVLKVLWCEPHGAGGRRDNDLYTHKTIRYNGNLFYSGIRRFIVVRTYQGHSLCVPIFTYGRLGCKKKGVKPKYHGIIYQNNRKPHMLEGEPKLGVPPVRINLYERAERISHDSRVNYSKLYSIEHNFLVFFIGSIDPGDFENIVQRAADSFYLQQPLPGWGVDPDQSQGGEEQEEEEE